ncbi:hypothetical protein D4R51_01580 [bacterium]|nr:MAG: hypothetical protein D4R51_01580 [bacterium]
MKVQNFSENLEKHLVRLGHDVAKQRESPESRDLPEREIVKQSLKSLAPEEDQPVIADEPPTSPAPAAPPKDDFLPDYFSDSTDQGIKKSVEHLLEITKDGNIPKAVKEARKYPPFVEDAFHDALIDKFMPELKKRGIIK